MNEEKYHYKSLFVEKYGLDTYIETQKLKQFCGLDFSAGRYWLSDLDKSKFRVMDEEGYVPEYQLLKHLLGMQNMYLRPHPNSKIVIIDIDQRSQPKDVKSTDILLNLHKEIGKGFYYECDPVQGNYHIWYEFKDYLPNKASRNFEKYFEQKYSQKVEVYYNTEHCIRLPFSSNYSLHGVFFNEPYYKHKILSIPFDKALLLFSSHTPKSLPKVLRSLGVYGEKLKYIKDFSKSYKTNSNRFSIPYGYGTRHEAQIKIAFRCLASGIRDFNTFVEICEYNNDGSSKDMALPGYQRDKILTSLWDWAESNYSSKYSGSNTELKKPTEFLISDKYKLDAGYENKLRKICNMGYEHYKIGKKLHGYRQRKFVEDAVNLSKAIFSMKDHRELNDYRYKKDLHKPLEKGVPVGKEMLTLIAKKFKISNITKIFSFLKEVGVFTPIKNKDGYYYSYKGITHVIHYLTSNIKRILRSIKSLIINSLNTSIINNINSYNASSYGQGSNPIDINYVSKIFSNNKHSIGVYKDRYRDRPPDIEELCLI